MNPDNLQPHGDGPDSAHSADGEAAPVRPERAHDLARELTGDLPCISCRYNLRSISVLSVCPECGTPVRATLLATVDPYADVLRPIDRPRLLAAGLLAWCLGALGAALLTWGVRLADALELALTISVDVSRLVLLATGLILVSGLGAACSLVRPHSGIRLRNVVLAGAAVAAYVPLAYFYWQLHAVYDMARIRPYFEAIRADATRAGLRIIIAALMLLIVIGLRRHFRMLTSRSLVLRLGRVDRQTMAAIAAAIGVAALGDVLHLLAATMTSTWAESVLILGLLCIALGSMLITGGLIGITIDTLRTVPVLLHPSLSYGQVMGRSREPEQESSRDD